MLSLPTVKTEEQYQTFFKQDIWLPYIQEICQKHQLPISELKRQKTGSAIVYETARRIIKLYAPLWPEEIHREKLGLKHCQVPGLPIPELEFEGKLENWDYIIMEKLPGVMLREIWNEIDEKAKKVLISEAASIMKDLHQLPEIDDQWVNLDWNDFVEKRCHDFPVQQRKFGLTDPWVSIFSDWLNEYSRKIPYSQPILLHCDLTHDHFLVDQVQGHWKVTGLIDFADAMKNHYLYEFGAPLVYMTAGSVSLKRTMLLSYGFEKSELNCELENHLFASILLHRFTHVPWYIKNLLPQPLETLNDLKNHLCLLN